MHLKTLQKAYENIRINPIVFLPDLVMALLMYITFLFVYWYTGAADFLQLIHSAQTFSPGAITGFLSEKWKQIIISALTFFFITFIFGATTLVFKFTMFSKIVQGKGISLKTIWREKKGYFLPVVFLRVIIFLLGALAIALALLIAFALYFFFLLIVSQNIALGITIALGVVMALCIVIYLKLALLFRYPIMFLQEKKHPLRVLRESNNLVRKEPQLVIRTAAIVILLLLLFGSGIYILNAAVQFTLSFFSVSIFGTVITVVWTILAQIINLTGDLWSTMYVFLSYKESKE